MTPPAPALADRPLRRPMPTVTRVALLNLLFYLLAGAALYGSLQQHRRQATLSVQNLAYSLQENASGCLERINLVLLSLQAEREHGLARQARQPALPQAPEVRAVGYADAQPPGLDQRDFVLAAAADTRSELILSRPQRSATDGAWLLYAARRVNRADGGFGGVVYAELPLAWFQQLIGSVDVGPHGVISVREADMALVARAPHYANQADGGVGDRTVSWETLANIGARPGAGHYDTVVARDSIHRHMAYRRTRSYPLYIFVGLATDDYLAPWRQQLYAMLAMGLCFSATTILQGRKAYLRRRAELQAMDELRLSQALLAVSETRFRTLYESISDAVWLLDERRILECNNATLRLFGCAGKAGFTAMSPDQLAPLTLADGGVQCAFSERLQQVQREGKVRFDWVHQRLDSGAHFHSEVLLSSITLDQQVVLQVMMRDITERKRAEEQIRQLAYFDTLTGLANRRLLMERLSQTRAGDGRHYGALLFINLDNFRALNDIEGRNAGDRLLQEVALRLRASVRANDTVARVGADDFIVLLTTLGRCLEEALRLTHSRAERIRTELCRPYALDNGAPHYSTCCVGATTFLEREVSADAVLQQGEAALTRAKQEQRNTTCLFDEDMLATLEARSAMQAALTGALHRDEFQLYYQAQVGQHGRILGAEGLLRWLPGGGPPVSPLEFIPLAEQDGMIVPIGLWVLQTACAQLQRWSLRPQTAQLTISINVSARQFRQRDFVQQVTDAIARHQVRPALLKLELTESALLDSVDEVVQRMHEIRALGVRISLDDFGTGFSSLSYLKRLPLDQLKIDQSFVRDVIDNASDTAIVRAILVMSQALGLDVVAEGVETPAQRAFLSAHGCQHYQGYLFGRPLPIDAWERSFSGEDC